METKKINKSIKVESYDSIIRKTLIDITEAKADEVRNFYLKNKRDNYIPPIFTEFVIRINDTASMIETCTNNVKESFKGQEYEAKNIFEQNILKKNISEIVNNMLNNNFKTYKKEKKIYHTLFIKYKDSINVELYFYNEQSKPTGMIEACYDSEKDDWALSVQSNKEMIYNFSSNKEMSDFFNINFQIFLSVSYYMQHFHSEVEYIEVGVKDNKKSSKNKTNGGYSQKITLKSKKKKYIIKDSDTFSMRKRSEATYHISSWLTRGHYRKCGKNKVIKYIPPTIHKRKNLNNGSTSKKTYEIK